MDSNEERGARDDGINVYEPSAAILIEKTANDGVMPWVQILALSMSLFLFHPCLKFIFHGVT